MVRAKAKGKARNGQLKQDRFDHIQPQGSWEIPRKLYHYSIGFLVLYLFVQGFDTNVIYPPLMAFLCVVLTGEWLRFRVEWFNVLYCKILGPLMRKSEVHARYNGVVYYLGGCIFVLYVFPRDIAALSIIYLSWTDPTASICGRLLGRYTPLLMGTKKSVAGSTGAMVVGGLVTFAYFGSWQFTGPWVTSSSVLPRELIQPSIPTLFPRSYDPTVSSLPLWMVSLFGGLVAAFSEFIGDSLGLDDNLTIPVVSASLLWLGLRLGNAWLA
ncbi:hypothetical protein DM01DRAFT_1309141 [Hesseltinella vesiculosa]|uniref:Phosphatidate cytidylyltransferase n=1 Tax=Hesseltinella vesiculosa TaxID=101127 RepID=A0A1X2GAF4_9FUNG|nr:hypothetical protein DM01DRAFT_1309141 [Hesseltinella vesiculosa]